MAGLVRFAIGPGLAIYPGRSILFAPPRRDSAAVCLCSNPPIGGIISCTLTGCKGAISRLSPLFGSFPRQFPRVRVRVCAWGCVRMYARLCVLPALQWLPAVPPLIIPPYPTPPKTTPPRCTWSNPEPNPAPATPGTQSERTTPLLNEARIPYIQRLESAQLCSKTLDVCDTMCYHPPHTLPQNQKGPKP
jgi:hypothetical protein